MVDSRCCVFARMDSEKIKFLASVRGFDHWDTDSTLKLCGRMEKVTLSYNDIVATEGEPASTPFDCDDSDIYSDSTCPSLSDQDEGDVEQVPHQHCLLVLLGRPRVLCQARRVSPRQALSAATTEQSSELCRDLQRRQVRCAFTTARGWLTDVSDASHLLLLRMHASAVGTTLARTRSLWASRTLSSLCSCRRQLRFSIASSAWTFDRARSRTRWSSRSCALKRSI